MDSSVVKRKEKCQKEEKEMRNYQKKKNRSLALLNQIEKERPH